MTAARRAHRSSHAARTSRFAPLPRPLSAVTEREGECPDCGGRRAPRLFHSLDAATTFLDCTLARLGVPDGDVVIGRGGDPGSKCVIALELASAARPTGEAAHA